MTNGQIADLASQIFGVISAGILYWQTFGVKWEEQTISGKSARETSVKQRQSRLGWIGFVLAAIAIGCQTYKTLFLG